MHLQYFFLGNIYYRDSGTFTQHHQLQQEGIRHLVSCSSAWQHFVTSGGETGVGAVAAPPHALHSLGAGPKLLQSSSPA